MRSGLTANWLSFNRVTTIMGANPGLGSG